MAEKRRSLSTVIVPDPFFPPPSSIPTEKKKEISHFIRGRISISSLLGGGLRPIKLNFPRVQFRSNKKGGNNFLPILCVRAEPLIKINNAKHNHYLLLSDSTRHSFDSGVLS